MGKYEVDLLDGFDGREIVYDEKKEEPLFLDAVIHV